MCVSTSLNLSSKQSHVRGPAKNTHLRRSSSPPWTTWEQIAS